MKNYLNFFIYEKEGTNYYAADIDTLCRLETESQNVKEKDVPEGKVLFF